MKVKKVEISNDKPFTLIAGPCVIESAEHTFFMVESLLEICQDLRIPFVYKSSFDKANRTSLLSPRGIGIDKGLQILSEVSDKYRIPVLTDVHTVEQCIDIAQHFDIDILQIPAFLCRQTDLLLAAGESGLAVNIKKGQFLSPEEMIFTANKVKSTGNQRVMVCERGTTFGYNRLVVDMCSLEIMKSIGCPVVMDATHAVQQPGSGTGKTLGNREMIPVLAKASVAVGVGAIFMEVHQDPDKAPSDGPNMVRLDRLKKILKELKDIDKIVKRNAF